MRYGFSYVLMVLVAVHSYLVGFPRKTVFELSGLYIVMFAVV